MAGLRHERSEVELPGIVFGGGSISCVLHDAGALEEQEVILERQDDPGHDRGSRRPT
jgi:hypothetical protein